MRKLIALLLIFLLPFGAYAASGSFSSVVLDDLGGVATQAAVSVDASSATSLTISSGKSGLAIQNTGNKSVWMGDDNVSPSAERGIKILPSVILIFRDTKSTFKVYFKCATGDTSTMSTVEFVK